MTNINETHLPVVEIHPGPGALRRRPALLPDTDCRQLQLHLSEDGALGTASIAGVDQPS